jgi:hypothetical protein
LRYTTVELDWTGPPAGGGPREPAGGAATGTSVVEVVEVGDGVSLGEAVATVAVGAGVDAAATCLDRRGAPPPRIAKLVNPTINARAITATSAINPRVSPEGLAPGCGTGGSSPGMGRG